MNDHGLRRQGGPWNLPAAYILQDHHAMFENLLDWPIARTTQAQVVQEFGNVEPAKED